MLIDYHIHTYLCKHAVGDPEEYVSVAEEIGLDEIGFADHCPWPNGYDPFYRMNPDEFSLYKDIVKKLKSSSNSVKIKYGLEIDWVPGKMSEVTAEIANEDFDYIIGSIHYIDDFPFDNPKYLKEWQKSGQPDRVWNNYVDLLYDFISSYDFDIIAHCDLPKKFDFHPDSMEYFLQKLDECFAVAGEKNMAIEINTGGLRKTVQQMFPSLDILKMAKRHGLFLTLGSDAHAPDEVGANLTEAVELAKSAGYKEIALFTKRQKDFVLIS